MQNDDFLLASVNPHQESGTCLTTEEHQGNSNFFCTKTSFLILFFQSQLGLWESMVAIFQQCAE